MKINESPLDRIIRAVLGLALLALAVLVFGTGWLHWVLIILGAILLVTGILGFCPLYTLFKINTNKK